MFGVDDGILAAGVGAVGNLLGGWMSGSSAASAAADANKSNRQLAREQMAFQERMSSSAYQRAVLDAQKAGLNPYITMTKGPASTPTVLLVLHRYLRILIMVVVFLLLLIQ